MTLSQQMFEFVISGRWPNVESDNSSLLSLGNGGSETAAKVIGLRACG